MSSLIAAPELITTAATDLANIGSTLNAAHAAAATQTTGMLAAAEDEVSAAIAAVFSAQGQGFQALGAQAAAFHDQFAQALTTGAGSYASAEAANAAAFTANPAQTVQQDLLNAINAPSYALIGRPLITPGSPGAPLAPLPISWRPVSARLGALIRLSRSCCTVCTGLAVNAAALAASALA